MHEVARARHLHIQDILDDRRGYKYISARRAICVILQDIYGMKNNYTNAMSWMELSQILGRARSSCIASVDAWREREGSQDPTYEEDLRKSGVLPLRDSTESIEQMIERISRRRPGERSYWHSKSKP
tara:strand:+ start:680 stop:1060 length:381 start_codon:yes stop_codon:yes gene_type:complete